MGPERETIMVLKVDLDCDRCYRKVKCLLCQYPQIHDQIYNEKQNTVTIRVLCCSPERIRDKLARKGGKSIKGIEIKPAPPPGKPADKPKGAPPPAEKPKDAPPRAEKPKDGPPPADAKPAKNGSKNGSSKPQEQPAKPKDTEAAQKPAAEPKQEAPKAAQSAPAAPVAQADPIQYYPGFPINVSCWECYQSGRTGPCYHGSGSGSGYEYGYGYGVPVPPPPAAGGWGGYYGSGPPAGYGYNYKPGYCVTQCGDYVNDDNPGACVVM